MGIKCFMADLSKDRTFEPGEMWFNHDMLDGPNAAYYRDHYLTEEYFRDWADKRPPLWVVCPNGDWFCVDSRTKDKTDPHGWVVIGEPPNVTVTPSIHILGADEAGNEQTRWHGWLTNGELI